MSTPEPPVSTGPRAVPRRVVIGGVVVAGVISWGGAGFVTWNAWRTAFQAGHVRIESAAGLYMVLALLATALAALPERWRGEQGPCTDRRHSRCVRVQPGTRSARRSTSRTQHRPS